MITIVGVSTALYCMYIVYLGYKADQMQEEHDEIVERMRQKDRGRTSVFKKR